MPSPNKVPALATAPWKRKSIPEPQRPGSPPGHDRAASSLQAHTSHLKEIPPDRHLRELLRQNAHAIAARLDKSNPLTKSGMEALCRELLGRLSLPEAYLGWTMVMLLSAFWNDQVAAVPVSQRMLLLPAVLNGQPAISAAEAAEIAQVRAVAERLGYQVLVADRSTEMMRAIMSGDVNAVIGLAPMEHLERAIDRIILTGIACQAIPLPTSPSGPIDHDWIVELLSTPLAPPATRTKTYLHLMRCAARMFHPEQLECLAPRLRAPASEPPPISTSAALDPLGATEQIAYDFLMKGGKHSRPFITLAVYDAMTGGRATGAEGAAFVAQLPDSIRRAALSIETFHKASLVHDDIEDDDEYRYGDRTLHRKHGLATAINVGDYLIGLGYRLVSRETAALGPETTADILDCLADAHMRLSEGQGAELMWRDSHNKTLSPRDAIHIYALKTAPAFEAALYTGMRLAGPIDGYRQPVAQFARQLGIAFQILNDLKDWEADADNKLLAGGDIVGGRPTLLWALALEGLSPDDRRLLRGEAAKLPLTAAALARVRQLYERSGVFEKAAQLVDKHQRRAEAVAGAIEPAPLRELLFYLIDMVLDRQARPSRCRGANVNEQVTS